MNSDKRARCDIVIPVWNNLELTRDCVDSIQKHTVYPYRVVIVDNASDTPTKEYLDTLEKENKGNVVVIKNIKNEGFVKGVNKGMKY